VNNATKITVIILTILLSSCASATCEKAPIKELDPLNIKRFAKPALDCLGIPFKKIVLDRIWNCEDRIESYRNLIIDYNND